MEGEGEPNVFTAGSDRELIHASEQEVVLHITACEWARYFTEHHPGVGYLVACSTDDADLHASTNGLWMQRTSTIMEGGRVCDFRIYSA
jgi:hypothetical protein